ncbi:MAG: hypothetical protein V1806_12130 [Pseudomonadota bacterium]
MNALVLLLCLMLAWFLPSAAQGGTKKQPPSSSSSAPRASSHHSAPRLAPSRPRPPASQGLNTQRPPQRLNTQRPPQGLNTQRPPQRANIQRPPQQQDQRHQQRQRQPQVQQQRRQVQSQPTRPPQGPAPVGHQPRPSAQAASRRPLASPAPRAQASVAALPGRNGFTAQRSLADGSRVVLTSRALADGRRQAAGYKLTRHAADGTQTRLYTNGRRVTVGRDFVRYSTPGQPTRIVHHNGLRETVAPGGRRLAREKFVNHRFRDGGVERIIQRTIVAAVVAGAVVALARPVVQRYRVLPVYGIEVFPYLPVAGDAGFYQVFDAPLPRPVLMSSPPGLYPPPVAVFAQPTPAYADPVDLLGDLQIAGALQAGLAPPAPLAGAVSLAGEQEVRDLQSEVAQLQQEAMEKAPEAPPAGTEPAPALSPPAVQTASAPAQPQGGVLIPEEARQQVRQQVRQEIALHRQERSPSIAEVMASAQAQKYIFQVAGLIDASDLDTGEECALSTGDLIMFQRVPAEGEVAAPMRVVTSKFGSCRAGGLVHVSLPDLQDMLNAFSQRLEANMHKLQAHLSVARAEEGEVERTATSKP